MTFGYLTLNLKMSQPHILRNPLAKLQSPTPSADDGLSPQLERELRLCELMIPFLKSQQDFPSHPSSFRWRSLDSTGWYPSQTVRSSLSLFFIKHAYLLPCFRPQIVMATAATLFQRFYFVTSFNHFGIRVCCLSYHTIIPSSRS